MHQVSRPFSVYVNVRWHFARYPDNAGLGIMTWRHCLSQHAYAEQSQIRIPQGVWY